MSSWKIFSTPKVQLADSLTGKVVLVTGANRGIGLETVKALALRGATVYLGARSEEKGSAAIEAIERDIAGAIGSSSRSPGKILYHQCDISTPALAKESAEKFIEKEERLDVLINNASILMDAKLIDKIMQVNYFGTVQFTMSLLPLLTRTAQRESDVRIVTLTSDGSAMGRAKDPSIRFRNWEDYNADYSKDWSPVLSTYCVSKIAIRLHVQALQRHLFAQPETRNITCIAVHPGTVTNFVDRMLAERVPLPWLLMPIIRLFFYTPPAGALTSCFAAASPKVAKDRDKYRGAYLVPIGKVGPPTAVSENEGLQEELWESTLEILKNWPPGA